MRMSLSASRNILPVCFLLVLTACGVPTKHLVSPTIDPSAPLQALIDRELSPDDALLIGAGDIVRQTAPARPGNGAPDPDVPQSRGPKRHNAKPYFHYFGENAGPEGLGFYSYDFMKPLWNVLLDRKADVILNGHDHHYEQFDLQDASGEPTEDGIRQFIVGTGGGEERGHGTIKDNSKVLLTHTYGVLLMRLHPDSYEWHFLKTDGTVGDSSPGPTSCHPKPARSTSGSS